jgi:hypothetical protein
MGLELFGNFLSCGIISIEGEPRGRMNDWRFLVMALIWLSVGVALVAYPKRSQGASKRFEEGRTLVPFPPLVGVPIWSVRVFGIVSLCGAAIFFYLLLR